MPVEPEIRVVYVEDDERLARLTTQYLNAHRVDVTLVTRGDQAVSEVQRVHLLDLMLPGTDGIEVRHADDRAERHARRRSRELRDRRQGVGIAPDDLPRVFTAFFRGERSRSRETGGVGLGLTLAKRITEAHGGTIGATSQAGVGTQLRVTIPSAERSGL